MSHYARKATSAELSGFGCEGVGRKSGLVSRCGCSLWRYAFCGLGL